MLGSVETTKLVAVMVAGGVFALAGLALLFRPTRGDGEHSAELFGLKFRFSSAGIVVFLVGAAFLAAPLVVQEQPSPLKAPVQAGRNGGPVATGLPPPIEGLEAEPNDHVSRPNQIEVGTTYTGMLGGDDVDYFVFRSSGTGFLRLVLRVKEGTVHATVFDANEQVVASASYIHDLLSERFRLNGAPHYLIRLAPSGGTADYEMLIRPDA
jgi:hypothetical protein